MNKFIQFIDLVKHFRPKFHNVITWTMVTAGIGLMANHLWMTVIARLLEKHLDIEIIDQFSPMYGLSLVLLALVFNVVSCRFDRNANVLEQPSVDGLTRSQMKRNHDVELYRQESAILDQAQIDYFYNNVGADHSCWDDDFICLADFHDFSIKPENRYLDEGVLANRDALVQVCKKLSGFLVTHFFEFPDHKIDGKWRKVLYPDLNVDRGGSYEGGARYDKYADELLELLKQLRVTFRRYRVCIKETYIV